MADDPVALSKDSITQITETLRDMALTAKRSGMPVAISGTTCTLIADTMQAMVDAVNTPHTAEFLEAVKLEAVHQRERWGSEHDDGKTDADWFWLLGHLASKAVNAGTMAVMIDQDEARHRDKRLHHIITTAAACLNWHAARTGADTRMRPGIEEPA